MRCESEPHSPAANACYEPETSSPDEPPLCSESSGMSVQPAAPDTETEPAAATEPDNGMGGAPAVSARAASPERGASGQSGSEEPPSEVDPTALEMLVALSIAAAPGRLVLQAAVQRVLCSGAAGGISGYFSGSAGGDQWESMRRGAAAGAAAAVFHPGGLAGTVVTSGLSNTASATIPETIPAGIATSTLVAAVSSVPGASGLVATFVPSLASGISNGLVKGAVITTVQERDRVAAQ